jgi:simple sugar transport system substrate-binding protein
MLRSPPPALDKEVDAVTQFDGDDVGEPTGVDRASLLRRIAVGGAALSVPSLLAAQGALGASGGAAANVYPKHPKWRFAFINHVTTNPFFVPTQYGAADAAKLVDASYTWAGSTKADVGEMINAFNAAISAKADGIAVCVVDKGAFEAPIRRALGRGIPVVSYNADGARAGKKARLAYIGQDLYVSGFEMGKRIVELVPSGDVALFIATPGALNIQPRIDGASDAIKQSGKPLKFTSVGTNADVVKGQSIIDAYAQGHPNLAGMLAVDAGSTQSVGQIVEKYNMRDKSLKVAGGFDLVPETLNAIKGGSLDYTIDQQPYLQGFLPVLYLYFYKLSGGLLFPSETNTGLLFVTKDNVDPYLQTKTRFEGSSTEQQVVQRSGAIAHS